MMSRDRWTWRGLAERARGPLQISVAVSAHSGEAFLCSTTYDDSYRPGDTARCSAGRAGVARQSSSTGRVAPQASMYRCTRCDGRPPDLFASIAQMRGRRAGPESADMLLVRQKL